MAEVLDGYSKFVFGFFSCSSFGLCFESRLGFARLRAARAIWKPKMEAAKFDDGARPKHMPVTLPGGAKRIKRRKGQEPGIKKNRYTGLSSSHLPGGAKRGKRWKGQEPGFKKNWDAGLSSSLPPGSAKRRKRRKGQEPRFKKNRDFCRLSLELHLL